MKRASWAQLHSVWKPLNKQRRPVFAWKWEEEREGEEWPHEEEQAEELSCLLDASREQAGDQKEQEEARASELQHGVSQVSQAETQASLAH